MNEQELPQMFNKKTLIQKLEEKTGCKVSYQTMCRWVRLGYVKPVAITMNGKQERPLYDNFTLDLLIVKVLEAKKSSRVKLNFKN